MEWAPSLGDALGERRPLYELQNESPRAVLLFQPVDGGNVRMVQRREHPRLALEPRHALTILGEGFGQDLERHLPVQLGVGGAIDLPHPAGANFLAELVMSDPVRRHGLANHEQRVEIKAHGFGMCTVLLIMSEPDRA